MNNFQIQKLLPEERKYAYTQSQQIMVQIGCIGHLCAKVDDFGGLSSSWEDHYGDEKTQEFQRDLDGVITYLNGETTVLQNPKALAQFCLSHPEYGFGDEQEWNSYPECGFGSEQKWGIRVNTEKYAYLMRLDPRKDAYMHLYCYCYRRDWLDHHIQQARQGIRFITPRYEEIFRIPDGDQIRITAADGKTMDRTVRYLDDYHIEVGNSYGSTIYHICEFGELAKRSGATVIPLRSSLPEKCFVYVESSDRIGIVHRGELEYYPVETSTEGHRSKKKTVEELNESMGVSKAQAAAMKAGSLFGWDTKAADPANYNEEGILYQRYC